MLDSGVLVMALLGQGSRGLDVLIKSSADMQCLISVKASFQDISRVNNIVRNGGRFPETLQIEVEAQLILEDEA